MMNPDLLSVLWSLLRANLIHVFVLFNSGWWFSSELKSALCDVIDADYGLLEEMKPMLNNGQYETLYEYKSYKRNEKLMEIVNLLDNDKFCKALQETSQQHVVNFIHKHSLHRPATGN